MLCGFRSLAAAIWCEHQAVLNSTRKVAFAVRKSWLVSMSEPRFTILYERMRAEKEFSAILDTYRMQRLERTPHPMLVTGLSEGARDVFWAAAVAELRRQSADRPVLCIPPDEKEQLKLRCDLEEAGLRVAVYPLRDLQFRNMTSSREYEHARIAVLCAILRNDVDAVLAVPDAALQYTLPQSVLQSRSFTIYEDMDYDMEGIVGALCDAGYVRCDLVDGIGEFAVRGGILDLYPAHSPNPIRMEFYGDMIDSMGVFDPLTQRKIERITECFVPPAKEVLMTAAQKKDLRALVAKQLDSCTADGGMQVLRAELEALDGGTEPGFLDKYLSFLYPQRTCLLDYFTDTETGRAAAPVLVIDTARIGERLEASEWHARQAVSALLEEHSIPPKYAEYTRFRSDFDYFVSRCPAILCDAFAAGVQERLSGIFTFRSKQLISYADSYETLCEDIRGYLAGNYRLLLLTENEFSATNLRDCLFENNEASYMGGAAFCGISTYNSQKSVNEIKNCEFVNWTAPNVYLASALWNNWSFGYVTHLPRITVDGLKIDKPTANIYAFTDVCRDYEQTIDQPTLKDGSENLNPMDISTTITVKNNEGGYHYTGCPNTYINERITISEE